MLRRLWVLICMFYVDVVLPANARSEGARRKVAKAAIAYSHIENNSKDKGSGFCRANIKPAACNNRQCLHYE